VITDRPITVNRMLTMTMTITMKTVTACVLHCSMLAVNMFTALITIAFITHFVACCWYLLACPDYMCTNDKMIIAIDDLNSKFAA